MLHNTGVWFGAGAKLRFFVDMVTKRDEHKKIANVTNPTQPFFQVLRY
jgi:hypothetical protein